MRIFILILILLVSDAEANVLRLVNKQGRPYCSCICVGRDETSRIWVTARHCIRNDKTVTLFDPETKQTWAGTVDAEGIGSYDMATFRTSLEADFHGVQISKDFSRVGDKVTIVGYPGGGLKMRPRISRIIALRRDGIVIEDAFIGGESGGGVFNQRNELIGIISRVQFSNRAVGIASGPNNIISQLVRQDIIRVGLE